MEPTSLLLLLSLGWTCRGQLTVLPQEPVVEVGGSIQLNCSLDCPDGKVQWKGLDTSLGNILSTPSYSLLNVTHATVAMEGTWICMGHCQGTSLQAQVKLQVYALPDTLQLETQPRKLVAGQPARLRCSISKVYPHSILTMSWYQGAQRLQAPETKEVSDDELFSYDSELEVPGEKMTEGSVFRCEVEFPLPGNKKSFQRARAVTVSTRAVAEEPTTESVPGQENPGTESLATTENPIAGLVATAGNPTTDWTSAESPSAELTVISHKPSPKATPDHRLETTETLTAESSTAPQRPSTTTAWSRRNDASSAPASPTAGVATTESPRPEQTTSGRSPRTASVCSLRIRPDPPEGTTGEALKITCEAECGEGVAVRWEETPVALSQYKQEASEGKFTLTVDHADLTYQGVYKCIMLNRSLQRASLHIAVSAATFSIDSAIVVGTAGSLLGLIVTAFASRRLWRRHHPCHTQEC